jgi:hypothetical protein
MVAHQITNHMRNIGGLNVEDDVILEFFGIFWMRMNERVLIPKSVLENYS